MVDDDLKPRRLFENDRGGLAFREIFTPNYEGPLPPRPERGSGKGGPSINQTPPPPVLSPVNTAAPVASGATTIGSTLSCTTGAWTNSPTSYAYQWLRNGANISGATASTYVVASGDAGTSIRCEVTATNSFGSGFAASNALSIAPALSAPGNTVAPVVSGTATVGATLSCTQGTWTNSPTGYTYQWLRGGLNISGATSATYVLVSADGGTSVSCRVTATNAAGNTSIASNALAILGIPANTAAPVASGTLTVGSTLSCTMGTWTNSPTYAYQWQRGGTNISGATASTYVTVTADGGTSVGCLVTATNASGSASQGSNTLAIAAAGHSAQALAYLARTVGGNEGGNGPNIATLIDGLVADGVWSKLDALYVLAQQNATDSLLNLIGTGYTITATGTPTFTSYLGYAGWSNSAFLATNFNAASAPGSNFIQDSASFGVWSIATVVENGALFGNSSTGNAGESHIYNDYTGNLFYARLNNASVGSVPTPGTKGLFVGDRPSSSAVIPYWNGAAQASQSSTSQAPTGANDFQIGFVNTAGSSQQIAAAFIGASLGAAGQLALYNRLRTYMTSIGVP